MSGKEKERGEGEGGRRTSKSEVFANKYGKPVSEREIAEGSFTSFVSDYYGVVAQESGTRLWYALAHSLAEKAVADFDRGDVEPDRPGGRRDEEA